MMTREQRERVNRLVETLLDVAPDRRKNTLDSIVEGLGEDGPVIRGEVERLLQEDDAVVERLATLGPVIESNSLTAGITRTAGNKALGEIRDHVPSVIGRYHLRGPLGSGGMGVVYLAEQRAPIARTVAIKLVRAGFDTHEVIARFEAERQALARMDHAHIARVFDAGMTDGGRPYFVMEYVPGVAITDYADKERLSIRARLELFAQVCDALNHAHIKGVIHRDLKPSNVLAFTGEDGRPIVKVIDFGIAKALTPGDRLGKTTHFTVPNLVLGTYEYMSPEQAAGNGDIDTRSDVYSLGVLLYELLSGLKPFERGELEGHTDEELRRLIRDVEPPRPSTRFLSLLRPRTILAQAAAAKTTNGDREPRDHSPQAIATARRSEPRALVRVLQRELEWIPMMAMRKDRTRRYGSAAELAADVRNCLSGLPLVAAPESKLYRARKFVVGHRRAITVAATALLLLVAGVIGTGIGLVRESAARKLADANGRLASRSAYRSAIAAADVALRTGDGVSLRWALESAPSPLRGWEWSWLAHSGTATAAELHHKAGEHYGRAIALPDNRRAWSMSTAKDAWQLWDLQTGEPIRREAGSVMAPSPDGKYYVMLRLDGALEMCETDSGAPLWHVAPDAPQTRWRVAECPFTEDGTRFVAWDGGSSVAVFDAATGSMRRVSTGVTPAAVNGFVDFGSPQDAAFKRAVVFHSDQSFNRLCVDIDTGEIRQPPRFDWLVGRRAMRNVGAGQLRGFGDDAVTFNIPQRLINGGLAPLPKQGVLVAALEDGSVLFNGIQPPTPPGAPTPPVAPEPRRLIVGASPVMDVAATPDERRLIVTMLDGSVHVCVIDAPSEVAVPLSGIQSTAVAPDGATVAVTGWGDARCFDLVTGMPIWSRNLGPWGNRYTCWSPDGSMFAVGTDPILSDPAAAAGGLPPHEIFVLDGHTGAQLAAFSSSAVTPDPAHAAVPPPWASGMRGLAFSADGKQLILSMIAGPPVRVDVATWTPLASPTTSPSDLKAPSGAYPALAGKLVRSPDGTKFAEILGSSPLYLGRLDAGITVRDAQTLTADRRIAIEGFAATAVAWEAGERRLIGAFAREDAAFISAFDSTTGVERFRVPTPDGSPVASIAPSPDGTRIIAMTNSRRLLVIDAATGNELLVSTTPRQVLGAAMIADGALILTDSGNAFVRYESTDAEGLFEAAVARWPTSLPRPATVAEARRAAWKANVSITAAHDRGIDPADPGVAMTLEPDDAAARAVLVEAARRRVANLNSLNSSALGVMLVDAPSAADLERATTMLRLATRLKPQSASLQGNLGAVLFRREKYDECREPLRLAIRIRKDRGIEQDPTAHLRLAIAARRCGDSDADALRDQAIKATQVGDASADLETKQLLDRLMAEFGT